MTYSDKELKHIDGVFIDYLGVCTLNDYYNSYSKVSIERIKIEDEHFFEISYHRDAECETKYLTKIDYSN